MHLSGNAQRLHVAQAMLRAQGFHRRVRRQPPLFGILLRPQRMRTRDGEFFGMRCHYLTLLIEQDGFDARRPQIDADIHTPSP